MDEFTLINKIKPPYYRQSSLIKGIGDDAAVFRETQRDIVTASDMFVENIHFSAQTMSPEQIGYRVLAVNLSDLAAMGANPLFYLVSIAVPKNWKSKINRVFSGMNQLAEEYNMDLIGGDTVTGNHLVISVNIIGNVDRHKARYRSSAKPSDIVFVTGSLGDSRAGLHILQTEQEYKESKYFIHRHRSPSPRINFALKLKEIDRIALNDISDGLISEAKEIASASKVNIVIKDHLIPVSKSFKQFTLEQQEKWKLFGGEDFELIGVTSEDNWEFITQAAKATKTKVRKVGYVEGPDNKNGRVYLIKSGKKELVKKRGYTHLL